MKYLELSDLVSLANNNLEPDAYPIQREGVMRNSNIILEFLDSIGDKIFVTCKVDNLVSHLLLTVDTRLPVGLTREKMEEEDWGFLFEGTEGKAADWKFVRTIIDNNNEITAEYTSGNSFLEPYTETPARDLLPRNLEMKMAFYYLPQKLKDVDGMIVLEIGPDLINKSGLVTYYTFREIPTTDVKYL